MKIVERKVSDVTILDLHGKILIGEGDDAKAGGAHEAHERARRVVIEMLVDEKFFDDVREANHRKVGHFE